MGILSELNCLVVLYSLIYLLIVQFRPDGSRRTPPPSTMHGWLAKMRGTLLGDEDLRTRVPRMFQS